MACLVRAPRMTHHSPSAGPVRTLSQPCAFSAGSFGALLRSRFSLCPDW